MPQSQTVYVNYQNGAFQFTTVNSTNPNDWTPWEPSIDFGDTVDYTFKNDNSPTAFTFNASTYMTWVGGNAHHCSHTAPNVSPNEMTFSVTNDSDDEEDLELSLVVGITLTATKEKKQSPDPQIILRRSGG